MNPAQDTVPNPPPAAERLKRRSARGRYAFVGLALVLGIAGHVMARAQTVPVSIPDKSFPESLSSTRGGTLYVGSLNLGGW
jgi:hypothetical protein